MAYTGYPTYPQYYPQYQQMSPAQMSGTFQQQNNSIIRVQGMEAARAYPIAPNSTVPLWDSESQSIYIKSADASGMPSLKVIDYTIRQDASKSAQNAISNTGVQMPTIEDINALQRQIDTLKRQIESMGGISHESALSADATAKQ